MQPTYIWHKIRKQTKKSMFSLTIFVKCNSINSSLNLFSSVHVMCLPRLAIKVFMVQKRNDPEIFLCCLNILFIVCDWKVTIEHLTIFFIFIQFTNHHSTGVRNLLPFHVIIIRHCSVIIQLKRKWKQFYGRSTLKKQNNLHK